MSLGKKGTLTVRLKRGKIACNPQQRATVTALGLKKREDVSQLENTPAVQGMVWKVAHLVEVVKKD